MSYRRLAEALLYDRPYFGPALRALQGPPERHRYILPVVRAVAKNTELEILEIGSWAGASAISWASALHKLGLRGRVMCVDAWHAYFDLAKDTSGHYERMNHAAASGTIYRLFRHNVSCSGFGGTIVAKVGRSRDVLPGLEPRSVDIVYVDGSHTLESVLFDLREAKRLVRPGGIVCGDDLELQLKDLDAEEVETAAGRGEDYVPSSRGEHYHPGVTLAVAREFGEVSEWNGFWAAGFSGETWGNVTLDLTDAQLPEHIASATITIADDSPEHHIVASQGRYFALAKQLGPPDITAELLGEEDLPPLVFTGTTIEEVRSKIRRHREVPAAKRPVEAGQASHLPPQVMGSHRGFNLVHFKNHAYGLRQSLGEVDFSLDDFGIEEKYSREDVLIGDSMDGIKARIDAIENARSNAVEIAAVRAESAERIRVVQEAMSALRAEVRDLAAAVETLRPEPDRKAATQAAAGDQPAP